MSCPSCGRHSGHPFYCPRYEPTFDVAELASAAQQLLDWQPICSAGSSGDLRQQRLRKALEDYAKAQTQA